jgi:hypothetical protein
MENKAYAEHLSGKHKDSPDALEKNTEVINDFHDYLSEAGITGPNDITQKAAVGYILKRRENDADIQKTIEILIDYAYFLQNETLASETVLLLDACNVINKMSALTKEHEPEIWKRVFGDMELPKIGMTLDEMSEFTRSLEKKMLKKLDPAGRRPGVAFVLPLQPRLRKKAL